MKYTILVSAFIFLFLSESEVFAQKLTFMGGVYSLDAASEIGHVKLQKPGVYAVSGSYVIFPHFEYSVGYTLFMSKTLSGDMGYGPDLSINYYPWQEPRGSYSKNQNISYLNIDQKRWFLQGSFHQRQFQSVQSPYSGFGFGLGMEYQAFDNYSFYSLLRIQNHDGPSHASLKQIDLMFGIQFQFFNN